MLSNLYKFIFFHFSGGLTAVIWTDFIQVVIMVLGAFILMIMSKIISFIKIMKLSSKIVLVYLYVYHQNKYYPEAQWLSGRVLDSRSRGRRFVQLSTGSTQEDLSLF